MSVAIASRDARHIPSIAKGVAVVVEGDGRALVVLLERAGAGRVLADVAATGAIAIVVSRPQTHRTLQLKGTDARIVSPPPEAAVRCAAHREAFAAEIVPLGFSEAFAHAIHSVTPSDLAAVHVSIESVFDQTPGPGAGARSERA